MPKKFEVTLQVKEDEYGDEYYIGHSVRNGKQETFIVHHPLEGDDTAKLVIKQTDKSSRPPEDWASAMVKEIARAEKRFHGTGYVGLGYFLNNWKSRRTDFPWGIDNRAPILDLLVQDGTVEVYLSDDGKEAIRLVEQPKIEQP